MAIFKKKSTDLPKRRQGGAEITSTPPHVFKRNRTLTGTTSSRLNSVGSDSDLKSPRTHAHNLSLQRRKITGVLLLVIAIIIPIWILINNFTASAEITVANMDVSRPVDNSRYTKAIQGYMDANPFSRISFFLNQNSLSSYVSSKLPEVSKVSLTGSNGLGKSDFSLTLRKPVAGWQIRKKQYYVDDSGIPFGVNYFSSPLVQIVDNSGVSVQAGSTAIASNRFLGFVGRVVSMTGARGYNVVQAALPPNTTRELEVRLKEIGYPIKFSIDRPAGEQVEDMINAVNYFTKHGINPSYVDVRVSGKAAYK